jgi:hypothetical protein
MPWHRCADRISMLDHGNLDHGNKGCSGFALQVFAR